MKRGGFRAAYLSSGTRVQPYQRAMIRQAESLPAKKEPKGDKNKAGGDARAPVREDEA